jgi:hypothetical protein
MYVINGEKVVKVDFLTDFLLRLQVNNPGVVAIISGVLI